MQSPADREADLDLLIIGAGGAGLVAAVSALEAAAGLPPLSMPAAAAGPGVDVSNKAARPGAAGAKTAPVPTTLGAGPAPPTRGQSPLRVAILEKASSPGGNTAQSAGMFAIESPAQRRKGIVVSKGEVFREKMTYAHWRVDPGLVSDCLDLSGQLVAWLEARGMRFDNVIEFLREGEAPRVFHSFSPGPPGFIGKTIVERLMEECLQKGVHVLCDSAAVRLHTVGVSSNPGGDRPGTHRTRVIGVTARQGEAEAHFAANAVILATGGFGGNSSLLERYFPGHSDVFTLNRPEVAGDGLLLAEAAGAGIDHQGPVLLVTGPHHYPWSHVLTLLVRRPEVVLVNSEGRRYSDETLFLDYHTEAGNALSQQPGKICYALVDRALIERMVTSGEIVSGMEREAGGAGAWLANLEAELEAGVARGTVAKGDGWEEVAQAIGADPSELARTVTRYNEFCERGEDADFFKESRFLVPLRTPPYYAVLGRQGFDTTLGGIKVDRRMRVLDRGGIPIEGLYAVGDCATGWEYENYNLRHPGSALTFALCSGYIAGREAAAYVARLPIS